MERLRILHTESSCGWGGQEMRIVAESEGLVRRGHRVMIVAPDEAAIHGEASARGLPTSVLPIGRKRLRPLHEMRRFLWTHRAMIDVVNTHSSTDSWLAAIALAAMRDAPALVRTRHVSSPVSSDRLTRWLYTRAPQRVVVTGERLREALIRDLGASPARVVSVPTGIDLDRFRPADRDATRRTLALAPGGDGPALTAGEGLPVVAAGGDVRPLASQRWIGVLAALRNWKGHAYLFDAVRALADRGRAVSLLVIGDGPQRTNLERRAADLGIDARVRFVGHQLRPERWLPALDVFVLPSYGDEGVSQSVMQAMACGLPVVVTDVGGMRDAVTHEATGLVVPPRDSAALAGAIARLLDDAELSGRLATAALAKAREAFGLERMLDAMEAVFASAVGQIRRRGAGWGLDR